VARCSLDELRKDYLNFINVRRLTFWDKKHPYYAELSKKLRTPNQTYETFQKGIESDNPEVAANVLYSLTNVTIYLLAKQLKKLEQDFLNEGGLSERMTKARLEVRKKQK